MHDAEQTTLEYAQFRMKPPMYRVPVSAAPVLFVNFSIAKFFNASSSSLRKMPRYVTVGLPGRGYVKLGVFRRRHVCAPALG